MHKLINSIQFYDWGSQTALTNMFGFPNPSMQPMAELWMGTHPKSSSQIMTSNDKLLSLSELINDNQEQLLGKNVSATYGELPFLFKVLCADKALSIQVHPSKASAIEGFAREDAAGIPLDASHRNYKDSNHKPELVFSLTPFKAMNGFREFEDIAVQLEPVLNAHPSIQRYRDTPGADTLRELFSQLLTMEDESERSHALNTLNKVAHNRSGLTWETIRELLKTFPNDSGAFAPLLLNVVELSPGEAMFLHAETPHAYLNGVALEVMASSDNVLRAGLTSKHIDLAELMRNVRFIPSPLIALLTKPICNGRDTTYPVPVNDFNFSIIEPRGQPHSYNDGAVSIYFCIEGSIDLTNGEMSLTLEAGESAFVGAKDHNITLCGTGRIARAFCL